MPPDVNESGKGFTLKDGYIRYGLEAIKGVGPTSVNAILERSNWTYPLLTELKPVDYGVMRILARVGALDSINPYAERKTLVLRLEEPEAEQCKWMVPGHLDGPNGLPCTFDWTSEPIQIGKSGKPLKPKPLPNKCFKGCRQYAGIPKKLPSDSSDPFTPEEIQRIEIELLGGYITSSPFDRIPEEFADDLLGADDLMLASNGS
jgi:DNA polymerase-3 subunit alpha